MTARTRKAAETAPAETAPAETAPAEKPAETGFTFEDAEVPSQARPAAAVNPFTEVVGALAQSMETVDGKLRSKGAKSVRVPNDRVSAVSRQIGDAAHSHGVTARKVTKEDGDTTVITFWTVERISHKDAKRNGEKAAENTETAPESAPAPDAESQ